MQVMIYSGATRDIWVLTGWITHMADDDDDDDDNGGGGDVSLLLNYNFPYLD